MFTVNWAGKEQAFSVKEIAINFMDSLNAGSDLWVGDMTLLRTRMEQSDGTFKVTEYDHV